MLNKIILILFVFIDILLVENKIHTMESILNHFLERIEYDRDYLDEQLTY